VLLPIPGPLVLDLIATVIQAGAPPQSALAAVGGVLQAGADRRGADLIHLGETLARPGPVSPAEADAGLMDPVREALALASRSGLPPTSLLRRAAAEERRRRAATQLKAIRRLEVLLVIPAGLCLLPAFVLLGIVPLVISLFLG
jgi:hypothetical protein